MRDALSKAPASYPGVKEALEWLASIGVDPDRAESVMLHADVSTAPSITLTFSMSQLPLSAEQLERAAGKMLERAERLKLELRDGAS